MVVAAVANECIAMYSLVRRWRGIVQSAEGAIVAKGAITEGASRERGRRDRWRGTIAAKALVKQTGCSNKKSHIIRAGVILPLL